MLIYSYLVSVRAERLKERLSVRACLHVDLSIAILICDHDEDSNTYYLLLFAASSLLHTDIHHINNNGARPRMAALVYMYAH